MSLSPMAMFPKAQTRLRENSVMCCCRSVLCGVMSDAAACQQSCVLEIGKHDRMTDNLQST